MTMRQRYFLSVIALLVFIGFAVHPRGLQGADANSEGRVAYGSVDGQELLLDVYEPSKPAAGEKRSAVLLVHGGGWRGGHRKTGSMVPVANRLARAGYVAFSIDYRLLKQEAGGGWANRFPAAIDDCRRAVRWIRAHADEYNVDAAKVGAFGESAGGHLVSLLGTTDAPGDEVSGAQRHSSRVQAVVNVYGPSDLTGDYRKLRVGALSVQDLVDAFLSSPEDKRLASPLFHIDGQTAAFLFFHGSADLLVPEDQSRQFYKALRAAGRMVEYEEFAGAGHGFADEHWKQVVARSITFFDEHLEGKRAAAMRRQRTMQKVR